MILLCAEVCSFTVKSVDKLLNFWGAVSAFVMHIGMQLSHTYRACNIANQYSKHATDQLPGLRHRAVPLLGVTGGLLIICINSRAKDKILPSRSNTI